MVWDGVLFGQITVPLSVWGLLYLARARVIADEQGLRWRGCRGWRRAAWRDVVSYSSGTPEAPKPFRIETISGTLVMVRGNWTSDAALRDAVERNAINAVGSAFIITQPEPKTLRVPFECHYDTAVNRNVLSWMEKIHKYGLLLVAVYFAQQWVTTRTMPGWGWLLTPTGLFMVAKQILPLCWRPMYRATQPRLNDKVFADKDGLRFQSGGMTAAIAWNEITDLCTVGIRSVVVTRDGERDFLDTLTNSEKLKLVIPRMAVNAGYRGWRTGTVRRQEIAAKDGRQLGECVYRYRSQENCGKLCGLTLAAFFVVAIAGGPALIAWQSGTVPNSRELGLALGSLASLPAMVWLWGNYLCGAIRTNEEGITQQSIFGRRFLPWSHIRAFRWQGGQDLTWGCVEGMNGTLRFWKGIGDADRLADEIAAHGVAV